MSAFRSVVGVAVFLLQLWGTNSFPTSHGCPVPCLCHRGPLINCSSLGLTLAPTRIPATAVSLNISNNALRTLTPLSSGHVKLKGFLHLWVGSNALQSLSLFLRKERSGTRTLSSGEKECMSWAPDLQLLSAERNHLKNLPRGLGCVKSLQILQLSYNQISELVHADLANCTHLKELHLQHNLIRSIHPHAFIDLKQLQVLDLSYNLLATIPVPAYQSLRNLNALVDVSFNKWMCDCNLQTLRRWIVFDTEVGDASWQVVCASPLEHAGKDLIHLKDSDLTCPTHEYSTSAHYQNMIVDEGMQILISCCNGSQDYMQFHWWTPHGQVTDNQPELLIKDITEEYAGLYICVSDLQWKHISVFDLHVNKKGSESRQRREAPAITDYSTRQDGNTNVQRKDGFVKQETRSESDFILAVCLSVIITFIVAFILGVLLRPLLDKLWNRIRPKRHSTPPTASRASSTGPQIYVNEGYSDQNDQEQEVRVSSRVTFGGITEVEEQGNNVPYYVTVEDNGSDGSSESNTEVELTYENIQKKNGRQNSPDVEKHRGRADSRSSALQESEVNALVINAKTLASSSTEKRPYAQNTEVKDFKPIPDADDIQLKRSSSSSESSHSRQSQEINFSKKIRESAEQSIDPPTVNLSAIETNKKAIISRFTKEPFSDWLTRLTEQNVDDLDPELWNDSGESFSFNEGSERSSIQDLSSSVLVQPLKYDDTWRQHKPESPSDKINLDKSFGKEVYVDSVQQIELSDILSSNSSECGDSEGGPNNYTINPVLEEESEILTESDTGNGADLATLNRFSTLEDVTINENSQQGAGILIKQETITLDPYDIHLTFTHGDSVDEGMLIDDPKSKSEDVNESSVNISGKNRSHEGLPLYHVHPVYRTNQNRDHDTDRLSTDSSSEDEEQFTEYPRKLNIKIEPGINTESITSSKNLDNVLDLDFDNSSSSTDVSEEKRTKGKTGLRALSALLFNRHENEADDRNVQSQVQTGTTTNSDVGRTVGFLGPTFNRQSKLPEERVQQTTNEKSFFGCIGLSFDQLPRPKKSILFTISDSQSPNQLSSLPSIDTGNAHKEKAESESRRTSLSSSSEESSLSAKNEENILFGQSLSLNELPKVKRYIHFSHSDPHPKVQLPSPPLTKDPQVQLPSPPLSKKVVTPDFIATTESRRSSSSSEDDTKQTTEVENFFGQVDVSYDGFQKLKRYIEFSHTEPYSTTQPLNKPESRSRTSSEDEIKPTSKEDNFFEKIGVSLDRVPKVKRHIQFNQPESYFPTLSFSPHSAMKLEVETCSSTPIRSDVKPDPKDNNLFGQISMCLDKVQKVKRSIQFTQSKPHSPTLPSFSSTSTKRNVTPEITEDNTNTSPVQEEDNFFRKIGVSSNGVSNVKRYIAFKEFDPSSTTLLVTSPATNVEATSEGKKNSMHSSTSKDNVRSQNDGDTFFDKIGVSFDGVPKVMQYLQFKGPEPQPHQTQSTFLSSTSGVVIPGIVATEVRGTSSSFENHGNSTAKENEFFGELGISLDRVPQLKRFLQFKQPISRLPVDPPTTSSNTLHGTPEEQIKTESTRLTTSFEDNVTTTEKDNFFVQLGVPKVDRVPKVKKYINFTLPESQFPAQSTTALLAQRVGISAVAKETRRLSSSSEDVEPSSTSNYKLIGRTGEYLNKIPKVKSYIKFTQSESSSLTPSPCTPSNTEKSIKVTEKELKGSRTLIGDHVQLATSDNQTVSRRLATSTEDAVTITVNKDSLFGQTGVSLDRVPKFKRYINFTQHESHSLTSALTAQRVGMSEVVQETKRSSSSSSEDDVKASTTDNNIIEEPGEFLNSIPKVKGYIQFSQSQPSVGLSPFSPSSTGKSIKVIETELRESRTLIEDDVQPATRENQTESRSLSTSSEDEDKLFGQIGASFNRVPKFKRYINFTQPESESPAQSSADLSSQRVSISGVSKETRRSISSTEEDVKPFTNDRNTIEEPGESLDKISKVKRYIKFKQFEPYSPAMSTFTPLSTVKPIKLTETELSRSNTIIEDDVQPENRENQTESRKLSSSSEDDTTLTAKQDNLFGQTGTSLNRVPKVKRYINFTPTEGHSPAQSTSALSTKKVSISGVAKETWRYSTSSDEDVKQSSNDDNIFRDVSLDESSKVKRYIAFSKSEPYSQTLSQAESTLPTLQQSQRLNTQHLGPVVKTEPCSLPEHVQPQNFENNFYAQMDTSFNQLPKVKRYVEFKQRELHLPVKSSVMEVSPVLMKKGSASVIKTESESWRSEFSYKDNIMTRESIDRSVEQTGLKPELRELMSGLSSLTSDNKNVVGDLVMDVPRAHPQTPPPSLEQDAREYLRDNSQVRQRQERRRLLQQRRKALDEFSIGSLSSSTQEGDKQDSNSLVDYGGATSFHTEHTYSNVNTGNTVTSRCTDVAEVPGLQGLKTRDISPLGSKSATPKYKEFLI